MNPIDKKLNDLGIILPVPAEGVGAYKSWAIFADNIVCTSGQLPWIDGKIRYEGKLGREVSIQDGYESAKLCAAYAIAQLKQAAGGDLTKIKQIIRVEGNVHATEDFTDHASVLNGASELFNAVFGDKGVHTRTAQGMSSSPLNAATLVYVFAELEK